jgi:hypothetical protein
MSYLGPSEVVISGEKFRLVSSALEVGRQQHPSNFLGPSLESSNPLSAVSKAASPNTSNFVMLPCYLPQNHDLLLLAAGCSPLCPSLPVSAASRSFNRASASFSSFSSSRNFASSTAFKNPSSARFFYTRYLSPLPWPSYTYHHM